MLEYRFKISSMRHMSVNNCKVNCLLLSPRSLLRGPYIKTHCLVKVVSLSCPFVVHNGTALVSFIKRFAITRNSVLPLFYFKSKPRVSEPTYLINSEAGSSFSSVVCFRILMRLQAQEVLFLPRRRRLRL